MAGLVELLIGILLFVDPIGFPSGILKIVGVILLFFGLFCLLRYFTTEPMQAAGVRSDPSGAAHHAAPLFASGRKDRGIIRPSPGEGRGP